MRLDNPTEVKLEGVFAAKFNGFEAVSVTPGQPAMIKVHFNLETGAKLKMELGSNVKIDKLNSLLTALGKETVKSLGEIDVPEYKGIIPAVWDKPLLVECGYPMKRTKVGNTNEYVSTKSNFAEVFSVIGNAGTSVSPGLPNDIPQL